MTASYTPYLFAPLTEFMIYFWLMGIVHVVVIIAGLVIATPTLFFNVRRYLVFSRGYVVFNVVLLLVCALLNLLWSYTVWGVAYYSMDYVTDFSPFWPVMEHMIYYDFGGKTGRILNGMNIYQVHLIWFLFAFAAWMITSYIDSLIRKMWLRGSIGKMMSTTDGNRCAEDKR